MHTDKVKTERWDKFSIESRVFTWNFNCLKCTVKFHTPKSDIRFETHKTHKNDFNLTMGQLLFAKYKIFTGLYLLNIVCWVFDQMNLIFNKWHLYDFIAMIRLWMHMIFEIGDLIPKQEWCTNKRKYWLNLHWQFSIIIGKLNSQRPQCGSW